MDGTFGIDTSGWKKIVFFRKRSDNCAKAWLSDFLISGVGDMDFYSNRCYHIELAISNQRVACMYSYMVSNNMKEVENGYKFNRCRR